MSTHIDRPTDLTTMDLAQGGESRLRNPLRENLHGGVCEGGDVSEAMVDLNAHEAGNGG